MKKFVKAVAGTGLPTAVEQPIKVIIHPTVVERFWDFV